MNPKTRPTLMVVDDEPEVLQSVYDLFRLDYKVLKFERGGEALKTLEAVEPDVILSDQRMPEMLGVEFLHRVKQLRPDTTRLLFTGYADIKAVIDAINQGSVFRYVTKPWDPEELAGVIRQAVDQHHLIVERKQLLEELQKANARLFEANRLKGAFIEVASHELNTPVAVVLGMTELWKMMQGPQASAVERGWVERIEGAGRRLASTVKRMFELLRADRFEETLEVVPTELEPLLRRTIDGLQPFLDARKQTVEVRAAADLGTAEVDPAKVADILSNLIQNAIKFTPDERAIQVWAGPDGPDRVRFRVTNPGASIGADERRHLFEPFFTGYDTMHHSSGEFQYNKKGIGLGLALVKKFVELHGGTVEEIVSTPDQGTTFSFTLPRRPSLGVAKAGPAAVPAGSTS